MPDTPCKAIFWKRRIDRTVNMIRFNITTLMGLTYLFRRDMATRRSEHILLVTTVLAFPGRSQLRAACAATKAYVLALGEALHDEFRPNGVAVTTLARGTPRRVSMR